MPRDAEWFAARNGSLGPGLRLRSHKGCDRLETRKHKFRRYLVCDTVNYCSRVCQALNWKHRYKAQCVPVDRWLEESEEAGGQVIFAAFNHMHAITSNMSYTLKYHQRWVHQRGGKDVS